MLEQLKYINHFGETYAFGKDGIFVDCNELHNYEWKITKKGNRIASLDTNVIKKKLPVVIICDSDTAGLAARNRLLEVVEKDTLAMKYGKVVIGDYYYKCFVTKSQKKDYLLSKRYMKLTLTLTTDFPFWVRENTILFRKAGTGGNGGSNLDYPHDYAFDYASGMSNKTLNNTGFVGTDFRMVIYGAASNPSLHISGHAYQVNCEIGSNEYLTIDSSTKKIYLTANDGTITNMFHLRSRDSYIFEPIPPGNNTVTWDGSWGFDITLLEERSEPRWT